MVETSSNPSIGRIVASYIEKIGLSVRNEDNPSGIVPDHQK
uniref:Uncharacterized protein n=1 Tax=Siphoviridae sp. ctgN495 TaxID=2825608 RepID=A0A8S5UCM0_9CAUD|nr:MAG TPA: hypothetical protein [Siphoviridae sp. ctgN495]